MVHFKNPVLFVRNIETSKDFYINVLEQEIEFDFGKNISFKSGLAIWEIPEYHIIKQKINNKDLRNASCYRTEMYFETTDINNFETRINLLEVKTLHEVIEETWGQKTIRFFDPDFHLIEVGESMKTFINRLLNNNMTISEISEKTSVPTEVIKQLIGIEDNTI